MRRPAALLLAVVVGALTALQVPAVAAPPRAVATAAAVTSPTRADVLADARLATDYFYANNGGATSDAGWRWAPFFMGVDELARATGDTRYPAWLQAWGTRNGWNPDAPASPTSNPDSRAAIQVWERLPEVGVTPDLTRSDALMAADRSLPASQYWWVDSLFMGQPLWPTWTTRTGDASYSAQAAEHYDFLKTRGANRYRTGCTDTGLFDATEDLWWRDCLYVPQRDAQGHKVMWSRGNGWVIAAMARTLDALPPGDAQRAEYTSMLQRMARRLAELQPADGMWRTSLLSPTLYPAPETSGTALFAYAMAYGIRTGILDQATYLPVVQRAWAGLESVALKPSGFLSNCQGVGEAPGAPSTTASIGYCVGAFTLAATEIAKLDGLLATDSFTRTASNGLGLADTGGAWALQAGAPASDHAVGGGTARFTTAAGQTRSATLPAVSSADTDVQVTSSFTRPTVGSAYVGLVGRRVGAAEYAARAVVSPAGAVRLQLRRSDTTIGSVDVAGLTFATGDRLRTRVQVTGTSPTTVRARTWKVGTVEPTVWQVQAVDATAALQQPGGIGVSTYLSGGGTPSPLVVAFDDLAAATPAAPVAPSLASDGFARTVTAGFGTADSGGAWTRSSTEPPADYAVSGGVGTIATASGQTRRALLAAVSSTSTDVSATAGFARATAGSVYVGLIGRRVAGVDYASRTLVGPDGSVRLQLRRGEVTIGSLLVPSLTFATGDRLAMRLQVTGTSPTTVRARVWKVGSTEPAAWQVSTTDATAGLQAAGSVGVSTYYSGGASPSSVVVSFDDLLAVPVA